MADIHADHMTDGRWHDDCPDCRRRRSAYVSSRTAAEVTEAQLQAWERLVQRLGELTLADGEWVQHQVRMGLVNAVSPLIASHRSLAARLAEAEEANKKQRKALEAWDRYDKAFPDVFAETPRLRQLRDLFAAALAPGAGG